MNPALKDKANELARYLIDEMRREHAARVKTRLLVVPPPFVKGSATTTPQNSASPSPTVTRKNLGMPPMPMPMPMPVERSSIKDLETSAQFGALVLQADELSAKVHTYTYTYIYNIHMHMHMHMHIQYAYAYAYAHTYAYAGR